MANNAFHAAAAPARLRFEPWFSETAFLALLLLVFVGLSPFAMRDTSALASGQDLNAGAGDLVRQICYLLVFTLIVVSAIYKHGTKAFSVIPTSLVLLLVWCVLSALWAGEQDVAFRRAGLAVIVVLSAMLSVGTLGIERSLRLLRVVLIGVLIVNWLSIPFITQAVHLPGESDPQIVGDWRGLYFHKNIAGSVSALSAIVFLFFAVDKRRWLDAILAIAAIAFTVMTHSKTSLALLPAALAMGAAYRFASKRTINRQIAIVAFALIFIVAGTAILVEWDNIAHLLENPQQLTGRVAIWQAELAYIRDHPLLGSGFGTFADTGAHSPVYLYAGSEWVGNVAHGHNGYLQLLVTTGIVGFVLAMTSFILEPMLAFWRNGSGAEIRSLLFAIFVFVVLHNIVESDFLEGDSVAWVTFLLMLTMLRMSRARPVPARSQMVEPWQAH